MHSGPKVNKDALQPPPGFAPQPISKPSSPSTNTQSVEVPSPIDHENVEKVDRSGEGGKKRPNWLKVEDVVLADSFMTVSNGSVMYSSYWGRIAELYNENKPAYVTRRSSSLLRSHWHFLKKKICMFNDIYISVCSEFKSSRTAQEILLVAHEKYLEEHECFFNLEHVWRIVKDHPVFNPEPIDLPVFTKEARTSEFGASNSDANAGVELDEGNTHIVRLKNEEGTTMSNTEQLPVQTMARASDSSSNQDANAGINLDEGDARITGVKRNEEVMTKSSTEQLPILKKTRAINSSSIQDVNAVDGARITGRKRNEKGMIESNTDGLLIQTSTRVNNSLSDQDANAGTVLNEGDTQIIEQMRNKTRSNAEQMNVPEKLSEYTQVIKAKLEIKKAKVEAVKAATEAKNRELEIEKAKVEAKNRELWMEECMFLFKETSQMTEQQRTLHGKACEIIIRRWNSENI